MVRSAVFGASRTMKAEHFCKSHPALKQAVARKSLPEGLDRGVVMREEAGRFRAGDVLREVVDKQDGRARRTHSRVNPTRSVTW